MRPRVLVVTDSDSYVKYGGGLTARMRNHWDCSLIVVAGNALPSDRQISEALHRTDLASDDVQFVDRAALRQMIRSGAFDVVVVAARGMTAEPVISMAARTPNRPVLVTALPGVSIPPLAPGLRFREGVDVFVVHSKRELRESRALAKRRGLRHRFELGSLPFLNRGERDASGHRDRIVFASQAVVPADESDRQWLLDRLIETARKHPDLDVVIKLRARAGESQTHVERFSFEDMLAAKAAVGVAIPQNLIIDVGPMADHLAKAIGCVTVSSTAVLEAVSMGVPSLVLTDFGVGPSQINQVFEDSGLLGTTDDLIAGRFNEPHPDWGDDNYLHSTSEETWIAAVEELLAQRAAGQLDPVKRSTPTNPIRIGRRLLYDKIAFGGSPKALLNRAYVKSAFWHGDRRWRTRR